MLFPDQVEEQRVGNVGWRWLQEEGKRDVEVGGLSGAYRADAEVGVVAVGVVLVRAGTGVQGGEWKGRKSGWIRKGSGQQGRLRDKVVVLQAVVLHAGVQGGRAV
jgi:hypothetical protein